VKIPILRMRRGFAILSGAKDPGEWYHRGDAVPLTPLTGILRFAQDGEARRSG
jgi:hypothetical protein